MDNQKPLWKHEDSAGSTPPLRRPNLDNSKRNSITQSANDSLVNQSLSDSFNKSVTINQSEDIVKSSTLNVLAAEFVPASYQSGTSQSTTPAVEYRATAQQRMDKIRSPRVNDSGPALLNNRGDDEEKGQAICMLEEIIQMLTDEPGQFDNMLEAFIDAFKPYYDDLEMIVGLTGLIFGQACAQPNFRYSAARLCRAIEEQSPLFRSNLALVCNEQLNEKPSDPNILMFVAELYTQFNYETYAELVLTAISNVLVKEDETHIKSACQALKLTAHSLDETNKEAMNMIFTKLFDMKAQLANPRLVNLIESVIVLRLNNWGKAQSNSSTTTNRFEDEKSAPAALGPVYYGPDGVELTSEEKQFLFDSCNNQVESLDDDSDPDGIWDPDPDMDQEIQDAFRQFVAYSKTQH